MRLQLERRFQHAAQSSATRAAVLAQVFQHHRVVQRVPDEQRRTAERPHIAQQEAAPRRPQHAQPGHTILRIDEGTRQRLLTLGSDIPDKAKRGPDPLLALVKSEIARWSPVIQAAGITVE